MGFRAEEYRGCRRGLQLYNRVYNRSSRGRSRCNIECSVHGFVYLLLELRVYKEGTLHLGRFILLGGAAHPQTLNPNPKSSKRPDFRALLGNLCPHSKTTVGALMIRIGFLASFIVYF